MEEAGDAQKMGKKKQSLARISLRPRHRSETGEREVGREQAWESGCKHCTVTDVYLRNSMLEKWSAQGSIILSP